MGLGIESPKLENNPDIISRVLVGRVCVALRADAGVALCVRVPLCGNVVAEAGLCVRGEGDDVALVGSEAGQVWVSFWHSLTPQIFHQHAKNCSQLLQKGKTSDSSNIDKV